ncbi:MAG: hypothetical protein OHK0023_28590 [Anaerolineae bacterium]
MARRGSIVNAAGLGSVRALRHLLDSRTLAVCLSVIWRRAGVGEQAFDKGYSAGYSDMWRC